MEFEEMQRIWDEQNNKPMYAIDQEALYRRIASKNKGTNRMTNFTEAILIGANIFSGGFIILASVIRDNFKLFPTIMAAAMFATAVIIAVARASRIKKEKRFDDTILGNINQAIANISYRVKLSLSMRGYFVMVASLSVISLLGNAPWWSVILFGLFFLLAYMGGRWEHKRYHVRKKKELESIREKLIQDLGVEDQD